MNATCYALFAFGLVACGVQDPATTQQSAEHASSKTPGALAECPAVRPRYGDCVKTGGSLPPFFSAVTVSSSKQGFDFTTVAGDSTIPTAYIPDHIVRTGSDYHYAADGTVLADLPSLESSYCEDGTLYRNEVTVLPDSSLAQERIRMWTEPDSSLRFELVVDGSLLLEARCTAG